MDQRVFEWMLEQDKDIWDEALSAQGKEEE